MTQRRYRRTKGARCPFCGSSELEGGSFNVDSGSASQEMSCLACDKEWHDTYELTGYQEN